MQILNIVNKTFPGSLSEKAPPSWKSCASDVGILSCGFDAHRPILQRIQNSGTVASGGERTSLFEVSLLIHSSMSSPRLTSCKFCQQMQSIMSSTASNYDLDKLNLGILIAVASGILIALSIYSVQVDVDVGFAIISALSLSYGFMMFASSYVEEEQHFWYWSGAFWISSLSVKLFVTYSVCQLARRILTPIQEFKVVRCKRSNLLAIIDLVSPNHPTVESNRPKARRRVGSFQVVSQ